VEVQLFLYLIKMVVEVPLLVQGVEVEDLASMVLVVFVHPLVVELVVFVHSLVVELVVFVHPLVVVLVMVLTQFLMEVVEEAWSYQMMTAS